MKYPIFAKNKRKGRMDRTSAHLNELISLLERHAENSMPLALAAVHMQNTFTTFFDAPKPLKEWKKIVRDLVKDNPSEIMLTEDKRIVFNPNRATQLTLDFSAEAEEEVKEKKNSQNVYLPGLFD